MRKQVKVHEIGTTESKTLMLRLLESKAANVVGPDGCAYGVMEPMPEQAMVYLEEDSIWTAPQVVALWGVSTKLKFAVVGHAFTEFVTWEGFESGKDKRIVRAMQDLDANMKFVFCGLVSEEQTTE